MKKILLYILLGFSLNAYSQDPDDVLKYSWFVPHGTPRSNALAGAMGSLGGDLSSSNINPAGLGFYKSNEFLLTSKYSKKTNIVIGRTSLLWQGNQLMKLLNVLIL